MADQDLILRAMKDSPCHGNGCSLDLDNDRCGDQDQCEFIRVWLAAYEAGRQSVSVPPEIREGVARIIDPGEWLGEYPNAWGRETSLAKADAILTLLTTKEP